MKIVETVCSRRRCHAYSIGIRRLRSSPPQSGQRFGLSAAV